MKLLKRSIALLMGLLLCLGLSTFSAFAEGGDGTDPSDPTGSNESADVMVETDEEEAESETGEGDGDAPAEVPSDTVDSEGDDLSEGSELAEKSSDEEQSEPLSLSAEALEDAQIHNGKAEFAVKAVCSQEDVEIVYQWQKLNSNGAFNEIEDAAERLRSREAAWKNMEGETKAELAFTGIDDFSAYEGLLFRCRISAGDAVIYTNEVKLIEELPSVETEPEPSAEPAEEPNEEEEPAIEEGPQELGDEPVVEEGEPQESVEEEETDDQDAAPIEEEPAEEETKDTQEGEDPEAEEEELQEETSALAWEDILAAGFFDAEEPVLITEDAVIPLEGMLVIHGGELIIAPEATLTVEGLLIIEGGTLTVAEGATLKNDMFIQVEGAGTLTVEGTYAQSEMAALVWDAAENASIVEGIDKIMIDKTIFVADAETLAASLSRDGFRTLTIQVPGSELVKELDHIPNGVIISVR